MLCNTMVKITMTKSLLGRYGGRRKTKRRERRRERENVTASSWTHVFSSLSLTTKTTLIILSADKITSNGTREERKSLK